MEELDHQEKILGIPLWWTPQGYFLLLLGSEVLVKLSLTTNAPADDTCIQISMLMVSTAHKTTKPMGMTGEAINREPPNQTASSNSGMKFHYLFQFYFLKVLVGDYAFNEQEVLK